MRLSSGDRNMLIRLIRWNEGGPFFRNNEEWCWGMVDRLRRAEREEAKQDGR